MGLNLSGVRETGLFEDIAVYIKIAILLSLAGLGIAFFQGDPTAVDFFNQGYISPITGFAIIAHEETALAAAVSNIPILGAAGFVLVTPPR